jgi:uncharacterized protein YneF (UPF0154 family)
MFPVLRIIMIVLVIIVGIGVGMWRANRHIERKEPEDPKPHVQKWQESMQELDQTVQKSQAAREASEPTVQRVEAPVPPEAQRD